LVIASVFQVSGGAGNSLLAGGSSPLDAGKKVMSSANADTYGLPEKLSSDFCVSIPHALVKDYLNGT
jgi:hypothetical protein